MIVFSQRSINEMEYANLKITKSNEQMGKNIVCKTSNMLDQYNLS